MKNEFKGAKIEKAELYAKKMWGELYDIIDEDSNSIRGEISKHDYLNGYNQALNDSKSKEILEMLKRAERTLREIYECDTAEIQTLIEQATNIDNI